MVRSLPGPVQVPAPSPATANGGSATDRRSLPARLELPAGLVGLPDLRRFQLRALPGTALCELRCLDERGFAVVAADLAAVEPSLRERLVELGFAGPEERVLVLLAAHGEPPMVTANLAGPIVVDEGGRGRQVVVEDPAFPVRAPLSRG
jgi:flagellar assembly factor FliW